MFSDRMTSRSRFLLGFGPIPCVLAAPVRLDASVTDIQKRSVPTTLAIMDRIEDSAQANAAAVDKAFFSHF